jgi:hypothetical protein
MMVSRENPDMETIQLSKHIGADGMLKLEMLVGANVECDITIRVRRKLSQDEWRAFLDETAGSLADDPIERNQPPYPDVRDEIE